MKVNNQKRIIKEDFPDKYQDLIDALAFALNPFLEQVTNALNKNIDTDNLVDDYVTISVENVSGNLKMPVEIKNTVKTRLKGISCIQAQNTTNTNVYPTSAVFVVYTITSNNIIKVLKVLGLPDNNKFSLTLRLHG